jgi:glycosyltransferase involved in cell wall biosynthesis
MCRALKAGGIDVLLATTDADLDDAPPRNTIVDYQQIPSIFFQSQLGQSFKFSRTMSLWLRDHVRQFDLIHIHAVFNHSCVAAARACQKGGVPYIIRPLGTLESWSMKQKKLRKQVFWKIVGEKMLRGATSVHYTTAAEQTAVEQTYDLKNGKVIPLGVESEWPTVSQTNSQSSPLVPDIKNGYPYVLVLSRLHPKKGLDVLIDAFLNVIADDNLQAWRLLIAGDGPRDYVRQLQDQVKRARASKRVLFPGWLNGEQKWHALTNAALLALPSYQENFGICVVEALTCGVPVVVSEHVNLADEIDRAGAGWVTAVDCESIENALRNALANEEERRRRGLAGKLLSKQFSVETMATELIRLYSSVTFTNEHNTVATERLANTNAICCAHKAD